MESWVTILSMIILVAGTMSLVYFAERIRKIISAKREASDILEGMMMELSVTTKDQLQ